VVLKTAFGCHNLPMIAPILITKDFSCHTTTQNQTMEMKNKIGMASMFFYGKFSFIKTKVRIIQEIFWF
jgi:hypothetical protein